MDITNFVGSAVLSAFIALTTWAMLQYLRKRIPLDPRSVAGNYAITQRFDSVQEIERFHDGVKATVSAKANAALTSYQQAMSRELAQIDPVSAAKFPIPKARFEDLI